MLLDISDFDPVFFPVDKQNCGNCSNIGHSSCDRVINQLPKHGFIYNCLSYKPLQRRKLRKDIQLNFNFERRY